VASANAESTKVFIPGKRWVLTFDIGQVTRYQAQSSGQRFQYAASTDGLTDAPRTILSFFLEAENSDSKQACYEAFWTKAASNPLIDHASVKHTTHKRYEQVLYRLQSGHQHANFYFVKDGLCADIHISLSKSMPLSEDAMSGFGRSLQWSRATRCSGDVFTMDRTRGLVSCDGVADRTRCGDVVALVACSRVQPAVLPCRIPSGQR
jgi:hypothetical protein